MAMRSCRLHEGRLNTEVAQAAKEQRASMSTTQRQTLRTAENGPDARRLFPPTIAPTVPLTKELELLHDFLLHQSVHHSANAQREVHELAQLSDKELDAKVRELVNWDFRLNLDEAAVTRPR